MTTTTLGVTGGVDTHGQTHHAAVLDHLGRQLGDGEFPTTPGGYRALLAWMAGHGQLERVGIEGTGTCGAALSRQLRAADVQVVEVDRPDRKARRAHGKSNPLDAYSAARSALAGTATGTPKARNCRVEVIRALRVARSSAVKARSQTTNQLKSLLITLERPVPSGPAGSAGNSTAPTPLAGSPPWASGSTTPAKAGSCRSTRSWAATPTPTTTAPATPSTAPTSTDALDGSGTSQTIGGRMQPSHSLPWVALPVVHSLPIVRTSW